MLMVKSGPRERINTTVSISDVLYLEQYEIVYDWLIHVHIRVIIGKKQPPVLLGVIPSKYSQYEIKEVNLQEEIYQFWSRNRAAVSQH